MEINRKNYETYLLDLLEGRLSAEDQQKVRDFLLLNPDCTEEVDALEPWILEKKSIQFPKKEQLKKEFPDASFVLSETNFDLFSIARMEGDLTTDQERAHATMVEENAEKKSEWNKWQRTKLVPDNIVFTEKDQLKRRKWISRQTLWMIIISSAAVVVLFLALFRIDQKAPDVELTNKVGSLQQAVKIPSIQQTPDPFPQIQEAPVIQQEEPEISADKPVMFSKRKQSVQPQVSMNTSGLKDSDVIIDTLKRIQQEKIQPGTISIASYLPGSPGMVGKGMYDQIKSLEIPSTSIHLTSLSLSQLAEIDLQEALKDYTTESNFSFWTIADAGIKGINRLTGADMSLMAARNEDGNVSGFRFKAKRFSIATPFDQSE